MLASRPGHAESLTAFYEVSWAGMPAAHLVLSFGGDGGTYRDAIRIETVGMSHWLTHFRATAHAEGVLDGDGIAAPTRYSARYDSHKRRDKLLRLDFVHRGAETIAERGPGDSSRRRPLAETYRRNVLDPLSALADIRERLRRGPIRAGENFVLPVFDDTRRLDIGVRVETAGGGGKPLLLHLDLNQIASTRDDRRHGKDHAGAVPRQVELTLSDDHRLLPMSMRVEVGLLPLIARFDHLCADFQRCAETNGHEAAPPASN
jgi:hypothetical protein